MNSFPNPSYSTEGEAVLRPSLLFRPLEFPSGLASSAGAELGFDCPDFSFWRRVSGLTSSLGSQILMGLLEDLDVRQLFSRKCGSGLILKTVLPRHCLSRRFSGPETLLSSLLFPPSWFILHLNEGCPSRFQIIKRNWALGPDILKSWLRSVLWMTDQLLSCGSQSPSHHQLHRQRSPPITGCIQSVHAVKKKLVTSGVFEIHCTHIPSNVLEVHD